ncbi:hypothetical protein [Streptomyces sp. NPDC093094]|uniref:hypothetical protein n=1 Tax=Streptomyces sp. NPDC093094 TaxID=3366026 RepID=UPI00381EC8BA
MPHELTTPEQFHAFAETVAREPGAHRHTAPVTGYVDRTGQQLVDGEGGTLLLYRSDDHRPELLKTSRTTTPVRPPAPQAEARARRAVAQAVAAALPGARTDEQPHRTPATRQGAGVRPGGAPASPPGPGETGRRPRHPAAPARRSRCRPRSPVP